MGSLWCLEAIHSHIINQSEDAYCFKGALPSRVAYKGKLHCVTCQETATVPEFENVISLRITCLKGGNLY